MRILKFYNRKLFKINKTKWMQNNYPKENTRKEAFKMLKINRKMI